MPAATAAFVCVVALGLPCRGQGTLPAEMARTACDTDSSGFNRTGAPGADGMALDQRNFTWVVPCHRGAVKAFREWSEAARKHNDALIARQQVMAAAWKAHGASAPADDKEFAAGWLKARAEALRKSGMDVIFE
jgi:hypothetical protein